ncbi:2-succinyl-5-enolpyruvyl-6-hydroxy-3-cyclohexene-1-carboxylic-acid synthase [Shewanella waksmanii]|uniref:2-succinyl-5-enolpyruvyl-6-hydroxy-3- cyclohexene-1-carboxylic-acid synthase n=1 Tax=Shewanella waksmanii TaxID=213783 RepID=UPI003736647C
MQTNKTAELNLLWGTLILEELARLGAKHVCLAPGSRSTPLTLAAAKQTKLKQHLHFDERGLGFLALGLAKSSQAPVAIITTSGTAVANLYPAIIEAWLTQVPLIVLSGDRPPELIDCGANQAIMQPNIFANYAKSINLPTADLSIAPEVLLTSIDNALASTKGPVHINCMYREPLYPSRMSNDFTDYLASLGNWQHGHTPYTQYVNPAPQASPANDMLARFVHGKGIIVAGTLPPEADPMLLVALSQKLGWPIVADAQSQLRQHPGVIGHIDQLLHQPKASALLRQAEKVLVFGGRLLSKRLMSFIDEQKWKEYWQVLPTHHRLDPQHNTKQIWLAELSHFCQLTWPRSSSAHWALALTQYNQALEDLFQQQIDQGEFGEAAVVRHISQHSQQLFIGNSLPVRLYDMFAPITPECPKIYTNRGASGIDGLLATACGIAGDQEQATTLIIGDISQLHDLNSLALSKQRQCPFIVVILNNDGGNIFNLLPVPDEKLRSDYYRLSHGLEFGYAAAMFGLPYNRIEDIDTFKAVYREASCYNGTSVIEVCVSQHQASEQIARLATWIKQH